MAKNCMICGRPIAKKIKLPNGAVYLCTDMDCLNEFNYRVNGGSVPIVWFSMSDFINHDEATEEITKPLMGDHYVANTLAKEVCDYIWGGETLGNIFHDAIEESVPTLEELFVRHLKDNELPLHMNSLKTEAGRTAFEKRLKGGK